MSSCNAPVRAQNVQVPDDLAERDQWVLWRNERVNDRRTKVPYDITGMRASTTNPRCWASFTDTLLTWQRNREEYAGLGYVFSPDDGFAGIDLDRALDENGRPKRWVSPIIERFSDTYMEISPSGRGLKIWARGSLPSSVGGTRIGDGSIEMYDRARYFAVTAQRFRGAPLHIGDHAADLLRFYERLKGKPNGWALRPLPGGRIPYGQQHNTLVSLCGTLRARGVCEQAIETCLQSVNANQCEKPGRPEDISQIVRSTRKWEVR